MGKRGWGLGVGSGWCGVGGGSKGLGSRGWGVGVGE